ncbi:hypothetical protein HYE66_03320 [Aggregatibacter actinomycetemcomitans]|nr:hypothetical protein [Aggregatibacter actinomycetemcomitans]
MKYLWLILVLFLFGGCMPTSYPLDGFSESQKVLVKAIQDGNVEKVRELAAKTDLDLMSNKSIPLLTAAIYEALDDLNGDKITPHLQIITELVRAGAPVDKRGDFDETPLNMALMQEHPALLRAMLEGGLDPNFRIKTNYNVPIIFELLNDHKLESIKLLVKYGADIELMDSNGETPAHDAIVIAPQISYYLVSIGANIHSKNKFTGQSLAMAVFRKEKSLEESVKRIQSKETQGDLSAIKDDLDAVRKIKSIMIKKGIEWPPKQ